MTYGDATAGVFTENSVEQTGPVGSLQEYEFLSPFVHTRLFTVVRFVPWHL